jgi:hypothetical protein
MIFPLKSMDSFCLYKKHDLPEINDFAQKSEVTRKPAPAEQLG